MSQKVMLVGMPTTLEHNDLPFVEKEMDDLQRLFVNRIETTVIQSPTKVEVMSALRDHQIVHLSCHGVLSTIDPSQSRLLLSDWKESMLTVSDLIALNIQCSQLAFLSACNTASTGDLRLLDESINLASAVQLAGYPSMVGSLWQISDRHSVEVTNDVYAWMLQGGNKLNTRRRIASRSPPSKRQNM